MEEQLFKEKIQEKLEEWLENYGIDLSLLTDEMELMEFEGLLFKDFLYLEEYAVSEIFKEKTNSELTNFFCDHYNRESLIDFILFIIHFTIEEKINLFISKFDCNGKFFGHWATAYLRESEISDIINERILKLGHSNHDFSNYYKKRYSEAIKEQFYKIHTDVIIVENMNTPDLIKILVGASGATLFFGGILKFSIATSRLWRNTNSNAQIMFTLGTTAGSINLYGFCLEKTKPSPTKESTYESISVDNLDDTVSSAHYRTKYFIQYFLEFVQTTDYLVLAMAKNEPDRIWLHFQFFFWLITQPFSDKENISNEWEVFLKTKQREVQNIEGLDIGLESEYMIDNRLVVLNKISTQILLKIENSIHPSNISIFENIIENCNVECKKKRFSSIYNNCSYPH